MIRVTDVQSKLTELRLNGGRKTLSTGSTLLDNNIRLIKGYPWFIGGQPHHGKTEVTMELLLKWSKMYNWRHYCYLGEGGEVEDIVADLCFKLVGKPYYGEYSMTEAERTHAEQWVNEFFYFHDPDDTLTYEGFLKSVADAEIKLGYKFDTTVIDPFNDLDYPLEKYPNITYWLKDVLKAVRISSKQNRRVDIVIVHVGDTQAVFDKETNRHYLPPALPSQWEGGKVWYRRAFVQLNVWKNLDGNTEIIVNKAKPKQAKVYSDSDNCVWNWDWKKNRYFEDIEGYKHYIADEFKEIEKIMPISGVKDEDELPF